MNSHLARIISTLFRNGPMSPRELETAHVAFSEEETSLTPKEIRIQVQEGLDHGTLALDDNLKVSVPPMMTLNEVDYSDHREYDMSDWVMRPGYLEKLNE